MPTGLTAAHDMSSIATPGESEEADHYVQAGRVPLVQGYGSAGKGEAGERPPIHCRSLLKMFWTPRRHHICET